MMNSVQQVGSGESVWRCSLLKGESPAGGPPQADPPAAGGTSPQTNSTPSPRLAGESGLQALRFSLEAQKKVERPLS